MPQALLHPGVYIEEVPSGVRTITGVATSIALFIGWASKGPTDRAVRITSYADYERTYGGLDVDSLLSYAVRQFYDNGGSDAYVVRIVQPTVAAAAAIAAVPAVLAVAAVPAVPAVPADPGPPAVAAVAAVPAVPAVLAVPAVPAVPAVAAVAGAEPATVTVKVGTDNLVIRASSPGTWANSFKVLTTVTSTGFKLDVFDPAGNIVETFVNLSMSPTDPRYAPFVVNGKSAYIDKLSTVTPGTGTAPTAPVLLANGANGPVLDPTNDAETSFQTQLDKLFTLGGIADRLDLFNIICVPGLKHSATLEKLQAHAKTRRAFLIVDGAETDIVSAPGTPPRTANAHYSAYYFPWLLSPDPLQSNALRAFPPSGFVAGIYARTDGARGVWKAPAGTDASINGALGPTIVMSDAENGQLNPVAINCLRTLPVYGNVVWGARTLHGENDRGSEWKYVPIRRLALFLEESLYRGTQWVVFEPNDEPLWAQIRLNIGAFLNGLFRQGAFQGMTPKEAYFVKCDRETTTQADINLGIVNIMVGFAPLKPAEFVVIKIQQIAGQIQV